MSLSHCLSCDQLVEGHTVPRVVDGEWIETCKYCGAETTELPEDDPRKER